MCKNVQACQKKYAAKCKDVENKYTSKRQVSCENSDGWLLKLHYDRKRNNNLKDKHGEEEEEQTSKKREINFNKTASLNFHEH